MNKKFKERLDSWDLRSLFLTIAFLAVAVALFFFFTGIRDRLRMSDAEKFRGLAKAEIISIKPFERIAQGRKGTRISVDSYRITYRYNFQGQVFEGIDIIPVTTKNRKLIDQILKDGVNKFCSVRFDIGDPTKSILVEGR
jgi:hypothetical protein